MHKYWLMHNYMLNQNLNFLRIRYYKNIIISTDKIIPQSECFVMHDQTTGFTVTLILYNTYYIIHTSVIVSICIQYMSNRIIQLKQTIDDFLSFKWNGSLYNIYTSTLTHSLTCPHNALVASRRVPDLFIFNLSYPIGPAHCLNYCLNCHFSGV